MKNLFAFLIIVFPLLNMSAQTTITRNKDKETIYKREVSFFAGPCLSNIVSANIQQDNYANSRTVIVPNLGITYFIPVGNHIGYSFGFEYNEFKNNVEYKGWYRSSTTKVDNYGYIYYPAVDANFTRSLVLRSIDIPLCLRFQLEVSKNLEFYAESGIKLNAVISYRQIESGYINKKGVYPLIGGGNTDYHLRENDPINGYSNINYDKVNTVLETTKTGFSFLGQIGFNARTSHKTLLTVSCTYL